MLLQLLGETSWQISGISTGKRVAGSWWSVHTPACHDVRDSTSVGCMQWCDDSSKSPGEFNDPLCMWWYVVSHFLAYPACHVYPYIGAAVWIWYSDWHRRVPQHPLTFIQPLNGQWLLPDPHWTTSPSLLPNMFKFRSTPRTNFCWTPPLFSRPYVWLWSCYCDTISGIWKGIDTPIKWYNRLIYKHTNPRSIAPQTQYSELLLLSLV